MIRKIVLLPDPEWTEVQRSEFTRRDLERDPVDRPGTIRIACDRFLYGDGHS